MTNAFSRFATAAAALLLAAGIAGCTSVLPMQSKSVNPNDWAVAYLDQGRVIQGASRTLILSGQVSVEKNAASPLGVIAKHPNDMRAQFQEALANIDLVLEEAGMTRDDIIHMRFFVTDAQSALANFDVYATWIGVTENRPPQSFIGIKELFLPELMIEIEATAAVGGLGPFVQR